MNRAERTRTLTLTAVLVSLMMLFLGGRAFGLNSMHSPAHDATTNGTEWKRESEGHESVSGASFAVRMNDKR